MSSDVETIIRFDGPALANHEIDVQELAPALLALADMLQLANRKLNGDVTSMRVNVRADIEQRCFELQIHIFQSLLESARHLFGTSEYKTAKEIAEILDLMLPGGVGGGVLWFWKIIADRRSEAPSQTSFVTEQKGGQTIINNFYGDGSSLTVRNDVYELGTDPEMTALGKRALKPLEQPGYESLEFYDASDPEKPTIAFDKKEAERFLSLPSTSLTPLDPIPDDDEEHNTIHARVLVKTQRNEGRADWELKWAARAEWASIDDTEWLERFQSGQVPHTIPFYLDVEMDLITSRSNPDAAARFHVIRVLAVVPSSTGKQTGLFDDDGSAPRA
jgi:hypothetical protein